VVAVSGSTQVRPQLPQFAGSLEVSKQRSPHASGAGATHASRHARESPSTPQSGVSPPQTIAHDPQLDVDRRSASQPFETMSSQSSAPGLHASIWQVPAAQLSTPVGEPHAVPQLAQFWVVTSGVSQPSLAVALQSPHNASHAPTLHAEALHTPAARSNVHALLHAPQCCALLVRSTHVVPHALLGHAVTQFGASQLGVRPPHALPQLPQLLAVISDVSQPVLGIESQSPKPG
jgi:hypothetical protein